MILFTFSFFFYRPFFNFFYFHYFFFCSKQRFFFSLSFSPRQKKWNGGIKQLDFIIVCYSTAHGGSSELAMQVEDNYYYYKKNEKWREMKREFVGVSTIFFSSFSSIWKEKTKESVICFYSKWKEHQRGISVFRKRILTFYSKKRRKKKKSLCLILFLKTFTELEKKKNRSYKLFHF